MYLTLANIFIGIVLISWFVILCMELTDRIYKRKMMNKRGTVMLFTEIDNIINNEFLFLVSLPYTQLNFKVISDIKQTMDFLAKRVSEAMTEDFYKIFEYHGVSKKYVYVYIARRIEMLIVEYMAKNKTPSK